MLTRIKGAHIVDPANRRDEIGDLWIRDDTIVAAPQDGAQADETVDANGLIAMAGGIDIHSHIAGANVNTARLMLPEYHRAHARRPAAQQPQPLQPAVRHPRKPGANACRDRAQASLRASL